jgi:uncharacterized repeat protein (TIGR03803 family)
MLNKKLPIASAAALAIVAATLLMTATRAYAQQEKVLYSFGPTYQDASLPAGLVIDAAGNLYGTSSYGAYDGGTVFELTPTATGAWTETVLYNFCPQRPSCPDGSLPNPGLVFDAAGNLYGTTRIGGAYGIGSGGYGTVFELSPTSGGNWTETVLHSFGKGTDGALPYAGLTFDTAGNLYGTTSDNIYDGPYGHGLYSSGTVYELSPQVGGAWAEKILHRWYDEGQALYVGLVLDAAGNLYSSTTSGSTRGGGAVFQLSPAAGGYWPEKVLSGSGGISNLIFDAAGNLYGTRSFGGTYGGGVAFELSPKAGGGWAEKALYNFGGVGHGLDGYQVSSGLIFDAAGNLYGTTEYGGGGGQECGNGMGVDGCGTVFRLTPQADGTWTETVLYLFGHGYHAKDGAYPCCGLVFDAAGDLYGTTLGGGANDMGTAFEIKP